MAGGKASDERLQTVVLPETGLRGLLHRILGIDHPERARGIHRVIAAVADELRRFVDDELLPPQRTDEVSTHLYAFLQRCYRQGELVGSDGSWTADGSGDALEVELRWKYQDRYYIRRNLFIHHDLGGFLRRKLDTYIEHEVIRFEADELGSDVEGLRDALATARLLRDCGRQLIVRLARIEELQRKLWIKPKLVVDSRWCVSIARVPSALYPEICANEAQLDEWRELFGAELFDGQARTRESLGEHPHLVVDTQHFGPSFEEGLVASLSPDDLEAAHLAISGDNVDALRLLGGGAVSADCTFIDPPYNTGSRAFAYEDSFSEPSWISMIYERLELARGLCREDGVLVATIDDREVAHLRLVLEAVFGRSNFVTQAVWHKKYARQNDATWFSTSHDHVLVVARDKERWRPNPLPRSVKTNRGYRNPDDDPRGLWQSVVYTCNKSADERPNLYYPILHPRRGQEVWPRRDRVWAFSAEAHARNERDERVWWGLKLELDKPRQKVFLRDVDRGVVPDTLWTRDEVGDNHEAQRELSALFGVRGAGCTPKPTRLVKHVLTLGSCAGGTVLDFFAGSGTTAHAVLDMNRRGEVEARSRRFIVIESGEVFDDVLVPRIKKVAYASEWAKGRPRGGSGVIMVCRVLYLESYDDALNSLHLGSRSTASSLPSIAARLDLESWDLQALAREGFVDPFEHRLELRRHGRARSARVSLVETFEFLIGLRPTHRGPCSSFDADFGVDESGRLRLEGELRPAAEGSGWRFQAVWGACPEASRVLVVWRTSSGDRVRDELVLRAFLRRLVTDSERPGAELLWINGDHDLGADRGLAERWRVRRIEDELCRRMLTSAEGRRRPPC